MKQKKIMKKAVVIVAGGTGSRMKSDLPKQFLKLSGKPILMHTIERFYLFHPFIQIILVLPKDQIDFWNSLCREQHFTIKHTIACGGESRFHSVKNGLDILKEECLIAIHDGVRPLVSNQTLKNCFHMASEYHSAIPVTDAIESIRKIDLKTSYAVDRQQYKMVQTPQIFLLSKLKEAYTYPYRDTFTDDASVFENAGFPIHLAQGNRENIKITTPIDLIIGETILQNWKNNAI
jgi:2-C-methyl-D-erythritol 4-phosphate cytidylyltransferase